MTPKYGDAPVTAVRWFLWDSQFGRYAAGRDNAGGTGDLLYYLHTSLWAIFPVGILLWWSLIHHLRQGLGVLRSIPAVAVVLFLIPFSCSSFQLPHYLVVVLPFVIWMVIGVIDETGESKVLMISAVACALVAVGVALAVLLLPVPLDVLSVAAYAAICFLITLIIISVRRKAYQATHVYAGYVVQVCLLFFVLPAMIDGQGERGLADYLNDHYHGQCISVHGHVSHRLDYYLDSPICHRSIDNGVMQDLDADAVHVFTRLSPDAVDLLGTHYQIVYSSTHVDAEKDVGLLWSRDRLSANKMAIALVGSRVKEQ